MTTRKCNAFHFLRFNARKRADTLKNNSAAHALPMHSPLTHPQVTQASCPGHPAPRFSGFSIYCLAYIHRPD